MRERKSSAPTELLQGLESQPTEDAVRALTGLNPAEIPAELRSRAQWVPWVLERRGDKPTKLPYRLDGRRASVTEPEDWSSFGSALDALRLGRFTGVGFVFTVRDSYVGIDLDHVVTGGKLEPWAMKIVREFNSFSEFSPSGTGVHIIARGQLPTLGRRSGSVEMYDRARFFTMTGARLPGSPTTIERRDDVIARVHAQYVAPPATQPVAATPPNDLGDAELLRRMFAARNGTAVAALWSGETTRYQHDRSVADLALCSYLAFWTGGDRQRIDRLFRQSALMRRKWDERRGEQTYGAITVDRAVRSTPNRYAVRGSANP